MKSQVKVETRPKTKISKEAAERAWAQLDTYRRKLEGFDLAQAVAQDRTR